MNKWDYDYNYELEDEPMFLHCQECDFIVEGDYTFCPDCGDKLVEFTEAECHEYGIDATNKRKDV